MATETDSLTRSFEAKIDDVSTPRRTVTAKINTNCVDRYNTVIVPRGGDWSNFMRSGPAVLWEHGNDPNRGRLPVAHCNSLKYRKTDDDILGVMQFKGDDFSSQVMEMYASGTLKSFSVEFLPDTTKSSKPTPDEVRANPSWGAAHTIYRSWELTGFSAVSYPGNPEALAIAVQRGFWVPDETRQALANISNKHDNIDGNSGDTHNDEKCNRSEIKRAAIEQFSGINSSDDLSRLVNQLIDTRLRAMAEGDGSQGGYITKAEDDDEDGDEYDRYITHEDGQYVVHAEDGKVLGKHKTKGEAVAQLQAIEISKHKKSAPETIESLPVIKTFNLDDLSRQIVESTLPIARTMYFALRAETAQDLEDLVRGRI